MKIQCKICKTILDEPLIRWTLVIHGNLIRIENGWDIDPIGEGNYIETLALECDCGYESEVVVDAENISDENVNALINKFTGLGI